MNVNEIKLIIQKPEEKRIINRFLIVVDYYLGFSEHEKSETFFDTEEELKHFLSVLYSHCRHWIAEDQIDTIPHDLIKQDYEYIISELGLTEDIRFDGNFSVYWYDEYGQKCDVAVEKPEK